MEWISKCSVRYNPEHGQEYIIYLNDGGTELASYNVVRKSYVQIHYGEEYQEEDVLFVALLTNPWVELKNESNE